jgi:hypothetical protein
MIFSPVTRQHVVGELLAKGHPVKSVRLDLSNLSLLDSEVTGFEGGGSTELPKVIRE